MSVKMTTRQVGDVTVVDAVGRITLGDGASTFRDTIRDLAAGGKKKLLLNLAEVYRLQKKTDQARDTFERGLGAAALAWGPSDPRLPDWMERLAATLRQQEDYAGAEELEIRATRIRVLHTIR